MSIRILLFLSVFFIFNSATASHKHHFTVQVLSSPANQISGDDARIKVLVPRRLALRHVKIELNGFDVTPNFNANKREHSLAGRVAGLALGENILSVVSLRKHVPLKEIVLHNHSLTGPIFSGAQQQPFYCNVNQLLALGLGEPDDNCMVEPVVSFQYRTTNDTWADYIATSPRPADMATTTTLDGVEVDFIIRYERGTINRFIYSIATLSPASQNEMQPDLSAWNKRLLYYFQGGVAIGHEQGSLSGSRSKYVDGLAMGYAIAYSTGTKTGTHYNLQVGGETAIMVKDRFISAYANPDYTVSVGGSGGGIQQYVYAQNHPGLLDAAIPQYSYPDMVSQTIHIGDCELIERWIDFQLLLNPNSHWADWKERTLLEGMNASNDISNPVYENGLTPWVPNGSSECTRSWRGLSALTLNPHFGTVDNITPEDQANTEWTHFADAVNIYGVADDGFARRTWDNVGVQYGLKALVDEKITPAEFIDLNFNIGSWKQEADMIQEGCPYISELCALIDPTMNLYPDQIDPWSMRNMNLSDGVSPAPRASADPMAIENAYEGGLVNRGDVQIPMIDLRHYLEDALDMHNSHQSFASRQRLVDFDGDASNQLIWFVDPKLGGEFFDPTPNALRVMDEWMANIRHHPRRSISRNRPDAAKDSCFDEDGHLIAAGDNVWDGILNKKSIGACTARYQIYSTSRIEAGAPINGDIFKCQLQPLDQAIANGLYGNWNPSLDEVLLMKSIFPTGVCAY